MITLAIFAALQACDIALTYRILAKGGRELNPVMAWLFARIGVVPGLIVSKAVIIGLVGQYAPWQVTAGLCVLYAVVVGNNLYQLYRSK